MADLDHVIHELLAAARSVGESMHLLIDAHRAGHPDGDWAPYYEIDYDREVQFLQKSWFPSVVKHDPPALVPIAGFWFGLFNPVRTNGRSREVVTDLYVAGARQFELDGNADWAVSPEYFPEGRYANSNVLATIYRIAYAKDGLGNDAEQFLCLGYASFAVKQILSDVDLAF